MALEDKDECSGVERDGDGWMHDAWMPARRERSDRHARGRLMACLVGHQVSLGASSGEGCLSGTPKPNALFRHSLTQLPQHVEPVLLGGLLFNV